MEDFLTSFFITPFTGLAEGLATATSPLDVIDAVDGFVWGSIMILLLLGTHIATAAAITTPARLPKTPVFPISFPSHRD